MTTKKLLDPIHPGETPFEEFMVLMDISINELARNICVPTGEISAITNEKRAGTANHPKALHGESRIQIFTQYRDRGIKAS